MCALSKFVIAQDVSQLIQISVVGVGEIEREPDQAVLRIGLSAKGLTLIEAKKIADQHYKKALDIISAANIDDKFIKATRINSQPQYDYSSSARKYTGEVISRSLSITINDLDDLSPLMQALVEGGVSTIDGVVTGFQDKQGLQRQALALAAKDAEQKAIFLAKQLNREAGEAIFISQQNVSNSISQPHPRLDSFSRSANLSKEAPVEMFGTQKIAATLNVVFGLK